MSDPIVIEETPIDLSELKAELEKIKKNNAEPTIRFTKTEEYVQSFMPLSKEKGKQFYEGLEKLNVPRLKEAHLKKIIDTLPQNMNELKAVIMSFNVTVSNDNLKKIVDKVKEYATER